MSDHLLLIDASGLAYRALYTGPKFERPSDGAAIGGVLAFIKIVWKLLGAARSDMPTHACAVFDLPGPTFRHKLFPDYKGNRGPRPTKLRGEFSLMMEAIRAFGFHHAGMSGYEADDIIATLAHVADRDGARVTIVSSDKDMMQLVRKGCVEIVDPRRKARITEDDVLKKFGVLPEYVADVQALAGDPVDNIPGIPGLGLTGAGRIIGQHGCHVEGLITWAKTATGNDAALIRKHVDAIELCAGLTRLKTDVPVFTGWDQLTVTPTRIEEIEALLTRLECPMKLDALFKINFETAREVSADVDPLEWWKEEIDFPGQKIPLEPQCGFYERRYVKDGPWVPARIFAVPVRDPVQASLGKMTMRCEVGGEPKDAVQEWDALCSHPISQGRYNDMMAKVHRQGRRGFHKPVDLLSAPAPTNPRPKQRKAKR